MTQQFASKLANVLKMEMKMNHIQQISQDLLCQKLKLQMGLDPSLDIEPERLRFMWAQLQRERNLSRSRIRSTAAYQDKAA